MSEEKNEKKIEYLYRMNERVYEQLNYSETKNGIILGLVAAIIGIFVSILIGNVCLPLGLKIYITVLTAFFSVSLISCLLSFFPNLKLLENSPTPNLYFHGNISSFKTVAEYDENIEKMHNEEVHLEAQNIQVSRIIMRKHKCFIVAIHFIFAGLALPIYIGYILSRHIVKHKKFKA